MSEAGVGRYWCYACNQVVNPVMELEPELKCPFCDGGFIEEMESRGDFDSVSGLGSDRSLSLLAPILFEMLGGSSRRSRFRREDDDDSDLDREFEGFLRRRRRSSAILQLLQSIRDDNRVDSENVESQGVRERDREIERESLLLINPFNQAIIIQGSSNRHQNENEGSNNGSVSMSLGDYFLGPGLDMLLQHLAENDPNRYGTPPAKKEAVDALPTVKIMETTSCSVCLDDFAIGKEAIEMPCKHKFHNDCILPWLELHSSCPLCRFRLPADESKISNGTNNNSSRVDSTGGAGSDGDDGDGRGDHNRFWLPFPWPFNDLFSLSGSENGGNSSSNPSSSTSNSRDNSNGQDN